MYTAIYRDFRPDNFDTLVGQDHIVKILKSQIATGQTGHAYLFCGTRGTGKTTTARILAKALNCQSEGEEKPCGHCFACQSIKDGTFMDVIEIDAASNNGVDNIRELRESVKYPPAMGRNKVYIVDEVHMLSAGAFNALLKTLEEPPENVVFILATTEPQKLPATILSRCMRLDFRRVSEAVLIENMQRICDARGLTADPGALALIAVNADGSVRDSLSILEQCISTGAEHITRDDVAELLGTAGEEMMIELTGCVLKSDMPGALLLLDKAINSGNDVKQFMKEWLAHFRNLLMAKYVPDPESSLNMSTENAARVMEQSREISTSMLERCITELTRTISESKWAQQPRVMLEMCIVRLGAGSPEPVQTVYTGEPSATRPAPVTPAAAREPDVQKPVPAVEPAAAREPEVHTAPAAPAPAENKPASAEPQSSAPAGVSPEFAKIWDTVVKKAVGERPLLMRIENKAHLVGADDKNFYVFADDEYTEKAIMEKGRDILEEKMLTYYGRPMKLCLARRKQTSPADTKKSEAEALAKKLGEQFGMDIEVK